jgi:hypothetical protein
MAMHAAVDPDCRHGKHGACPEWTWDEVYDKPAVCQCACHDAERRLSAPLARESDS